MWFPLLGRAGRLGNQLHQIASTAGLASAGGGEPWFPRWSYERYFDVPAEFFHDGPPPGDAAAPAAEQLVPHIDLRAAVYLQDIRLWAHIADEVRGWFAPSSWAAERLRRFDDFARLPRPILGVHVRRGDNVPGQDPGTPDKHLYHPLPAPSYYETAMAALRGETRYRSVACFSDDIAWCREHLAADYHHDGTARPKEHEPAYATAPILDWIDFHLLARCDGFVLSNSTFGAWAAYLNPGAPTTVPWPWFGPKLDYIDAALMIPDGWHLVPREGTC